MRDEHEIGAGLRRVLETLNGRIEAIEHRRLRAEGIAIDWSAVEEARIDVQAALDALGHEVEAAIERGVQAALDAVAADLARRMAAGL